MYYLYSKQTGEYICEINQPLPPVLLSIYGYTTIKPPTPGKFQIPVFIEELGEWVIKPDYRGKWWNKKTKEILVVDRIGVTINTQTYTNKEPCKWCRWNEELGEWVFDLDLYKKEKVSELLDKFQRYLLSKESYLRQSALNAIISRSLVLLNTNKHLTPEQVDVLARFIEECDVAFRWISSVVEYEDTIERQILSANTKDEVDDVMNKVDFLHFDKTYVHITIADKLAYLSKISLTGDEEPNQPHQD